MAEVEAITGSDFVPELIGALAAPLIAGFLPEPLSSAGPVATLAVGVGMAMLGKGAVRKAGQGATLVSAVGLAAPLFDSIGNAAKAGADDFEGFTL